MCLLILNKRNVSKECRTCKLMDNEKIVNDQKILYIKNCISISEYRTE